RLLCAAVVEIELGGISVRVKGRAREVRSRDLDSDRLQLLLDDLRGGDPVGVAAYIDHRERERLPVLRLEDTALHLVAGLREDLLRLRRVVRELLRQALVQ